MAGVSTPLCRLAEHFGTDKGPSKHDYTLHYWNLMSGRAAEVSAVLEIGIGKDKDDGRRRGGSLRMWQEFFPNAKIVGVDRRGDLLFSESRIVTALADQSDTRTLERVARAHGGSFDLIVDDGSHVAAHQIASAIALMPYVKSGGYLVIEDVSSERVVAEAKQRFERCWHLIGNPKYRDSSLVVIPKC